MIQNVADTYQDKYAHVLMTINYGFRHSQMESIYEILWSSFLLQQFYSVVLLDFRQAATAAGEKKKQTRRYKINNTVMNARSERYRVWIGSAH